MNDFLAKPVSWPRLRDTLVDCLHPVAEAPPHRRRASDRTPAGARSGTGDGGAGNGLDPDLIARMQQRFRTKYRQAGGQIREALARDDLGPPADLLHSLRGAASYVGNIELAGAANDLEAAIREGSATEIEPKLARFEEALASVLKDAAPVPGRKPSAAGSARKH